jgi:hypothetical protein
LISVTKNEEPKRKAGRWWVKEFFKLFLEFYANMSITSCHEARSRTVSNISLVESLEVTRFFYGTTPSSNSTA